MIFGLIAALIFLRFARSPRILAVLLGALFVAWGILLFQSNSETDYYAGLVLSFLFALFLCVFISRIPDTFDRLRTRKG